MRNALGSVRGGKATYYLVDWKLTWEPRTNLTQALIGQFTKEWRALVRRTYIEDEAKEDNNVNPQQ